MKKLVNICEASKNFHRGMTKKSQNNQNLTDLNDRPSTCYSFWRRLGDDLKTYFVFVITLCFEDVLIKTNICRNIHRDHWSKRCLQFVLQDEKLLRVRRLSDVFMTWLEDALNMFKNQPMFTQEFHKYLCQSTR